MDITEKAAYIKGLADGLGVDESTKEGKIIKAMSELLVEMADTVTELDGDLSQAYDEINDLSDELEELENDIYSTSDEDGEEGEGENGECYEVACPNCGETVYVSEADLDAGEAICPACRAEFEVTLAGDEDEEDSGPARYEVTCPHCGAASEVSEDELLSGGYKCPECGEIIEPEENN